MSTDNDKAGFSRGKLKPGGEGKKVVGRCKEALTVGEGSNSISPGQFLNSGLSFKDLKFLLYYLGRVGDTATHKGNSAKAAGFEGHVTTLHHHANRILKAAKIPLDVLLQAHGAGLDDCLTGLGEALKAEDRKAFITKDGETVISDPFTNADAHRVRISAIDRALALAGHITKRHAITVNPDQVRGNRGKRTIKDLKRGPDGTYQAEGDS